MSTQLLTIEDLSLVIKKSVRTIRSAAHRSPNSIPPICRLPGSKRLYWREQDVDAWLAAHVEGAAPAPAAPAAVKPKPRVGRPTKAEQIARRKAKGG